MVLTVEEEDAIRHAARQEAAESFMTTMRSHQSTLKAENEERQQSRMQESGDTRAILADMQSWRVRLESERQIRRSAVAHHVDKAFGDYVAETEKVFDTVDALRGKSVPVITEKRVKVVTEIVQQRSSPEHSTGPPSMQSNSGQRPGTVSHHSLGKQPAGDAAVSLYHTNSNNNNGAGRALSSHDDSIEDMISGGTMRRKPRDDPTRYPPQQHGGLPVSHSEAQLSNERNALVEQLLRGGVFIKHGRRGKPHPRFIWLSTDLTILQ